MKILIVPDSRQDRERILRYHRCQIIVVEACQIKFRSSASEDEHRIIFLAGIQHRIQGRDYRGRAFGTLHQGREKFRSHLESVWVFVQVTDKIPVAGCVGGRDDRQAIRQSRQRKPSLHVHQALLLQSFNGLLPFEFLDSERKLRVYVVYYQ